MLALVDDISIRQGLGGAPFPALLLKSLNEINDEGWSIQRDPKDPAGVTLTGSATVVPTDPGRFGRAQAVVRDALHSFLRHPSPGVARLLAGTPDRRRLRQAERFLAAAVRTTIQAGGYDLLRAVADAEDPRNLSRKGSRLHRTLTALTDGLVKPAPDSKASQLGALLTERELQTSLRYAFEQAWSVTIAPGSRTVSLTRDFRFREALAYVGDDRSHLARQLAFLLIDRLAPGIGPAEPSALTPGLRGTPANFSDVLAWQTEAKRFLREVLISGVESIGCFGLTARAFGPGTGVGEREEPTV